VAETYERLRQLPGTVAWLGLYRPAPAQVVGAGEQFGLHELAVEDAIVAHQRPKLERYDDTLFVVLRPARYLDAPEQVEFGEIHVFVGPNFVLTIRHSQAPDLAVVRRRMEADPELLARGPEAILYAIVDGVVDGYAPVIAGLQKDIDEIETEVFGSSPRVSRRIYELSQEVIELQRATRPLLLILDGLIAGFEKYGTDEELRRYLRDVADHATTAVERVDGFRHALTDILTLNSTLVNQAQNDEMRNLTQASYSQNEEIKRISAWAAILFAPTLIGTVYGMNFDNMPELHWHLGYPYALGLMVLTSASLYMLFRRRRWL
jgi:magnesium transporter